MEREGVPALVVWKGNPLKAAEPCSQGQGPPAQKTHAVRLCSPRGHERTTRYTAHKMVPYKHAPSNIQARCMLRKNSAFLLLIALLFFFPLITNVNSVSTINCMENTYLKSKTTIPLSTKTQYFCVVWFFSYWFRQANRCASIFTCFFLIYLRLYTQDHILIFSPLTS